LNPDASALLADWVENLMKWLIEERHANESVSIGRYDWVSCLSYRDAGTV
jgi:hypothetical protein